MLSDVVLYRPKVFKDERGLFKETWNQKVLDVSTNENTTFVQDNVSVSNKGVLRGLHFQHPNGQGKLVTVLQGSAIDVIVDIRVGSPTFGSFSYYHLTGENHHQVFIPSGHAHGFVALEDATIFMYKCTEYYSPKDEHTLIYNDPDLLIPWQLFIGQAFMGQVKQTISDFSISKKDLEGKRLRDFLPEELPVWKARRF